MKTAMQEAIEIIEERLKILSTVQRTESTMGATAGYQYLKYLLMELLEKEKEQLQKAFSDGQETPINHPTLPHYSREEYYNDKFILETRFQD
jgi:hypothetical protein